MKVTLPVHGVTEKNMSSLGSDSEHGYLDTNEMLPVITETLPGITNKDNIDHAYHRQPSHTEAPPFQDYATTEDEDNAIDALLQLSESQVATDIILGDNSTLLPIGANLPDTAPMNISLDTEAVTAAIENIALEETVAQTSLTTRTQKTFTHTKRKFEHTEGDSDMDTDIEPSKTCSKQKTSSSDGPKSPKGEFKTIKFGLKKQ